MQIVKVNLDSEQEVFSGTYSACVKQLLQIKDLKKGTFVKDTTVIGAHLALDDGTVYEIR